MKEESYQEALEILIKESENLYHALAVLTEHNLYDLAELIVTISLKEVLNFNQKSPSDVTIEDHIEATELAIAYIQKISNTAIH